MDYRGAVRPPFIEEVGWCGWLFARLAYRGAVRPPFIEELVMGSPGGEGKHYRGAVRPPFIEDFSLPSQHLQRRIYRGAVRPPFIEELMSPVALTPASPTIGGQSAPPSLKNLPSDDAAIHILLSGGSPPPLH